MIYRDPYGIQGHVLIDNCHAKLFNIMCNESFIKTVHIKFTTPSQVCNNKEKMRLLQLQQRKEEFNSRVTVDQPEKLLHFSYKVVKTGSKEKSLLE